MNFKKLVFIFGAIVLASCGGNDGNGDNGEEGNSDSTNTAQDEQVSTNDAIYFTNVEKHKIPEEIDYDGKVIDANSWEDANGKNYIIRTLGPVITDAEFGTTSQYLYAYQYTERDCDLELVREIIDFEKDCEFDLIIGHVPTALTLTDIDGDNIGEVTFVYRKTCTSDVSGSTQKLIMLEDADKYILRGTTEVYKMGGDYEVGEEFDKAPEGFLDHAKKIWEENRTEYDFEL